MLPTLTNTHMVSDCLCCIGILACPQSRGNWTCLAHQSVVSLVYEKSFRAPFWLPIGQPDGLLITPLCRPVVLFVAIYLGFSYSLSTQGFPHFVTPQIIVDQTFTQCSRRCESPILDTIQRAIRFTSRGSTEEIRRLYELNCNNNE